MRLLALHSILGAAFAAEAGAQQSAGGSAPAGAVEVPANITTKVPPPPAPFPGYVMVPTKYHFKKNELGEKRPTVELFLPFPTFDAVVNALNDETPVKDKEGKEVKTKNEKGEEITVTNAMKVRDLILSLLSDTVVGTARDQVSDEKNPVNKQEELKMDRLSITAIALIPPSERRGGGISKETWADFFKDYVAVMPEKTGKKAEQIENAAKLFVARLQPVKTQKKILAFLKEQLNLWFMSTSQDSQEEFAEVKEFLDGKIEEFLKRDEAELLANL